MSEIADWLKAQEEPAPPPAAPRLHVVSPPPQPEPAPEPELTQERLDALIERRNAMHQAQDAAANSGSLRELMGRFPEPFDPEPPEQELGVLQAAVAEIVERQRRLEEQAAARRAAAEPPRAAGMEAMFEKLALQFEERAAKSFDMLENSVADAILRIQNAQQFSVEAAEAAAERAAERAISNGLKALEHDTHVRIGDVAREVAELRADSADAERQMRQLLEAVRQTLEHVAARLPERAGHIAPAVPQPEPTPTSRARAAALRAIEESLEEGAAEPAPERAGGPDRRRYIAAARRSAQAAAPVSAAKRQPHLRAVDPLAARPAERSRHAGFKRILLAGAAAAALLFGIYAGSSRFIEGIFAGQQTADAPPAEAQPARTAPLPTATPAEPQSSTTASVRTAAPHVTAPAAADAAMAFAPDPVFTGSLPGAANVEPLPPEIGGSRLRTRALAGDAAAQYEVGMRFAEGRGVARDMEKAASWLSRAAQQGLAPAQYRLASLTEKGTGIAKDVQAARRLYEQAAAAGNMQAMHNLGVLYAEGGFGQPDMAVALVWFRKAAEYGVKDSQYNLGIFFARGLSVPQDLAEAYLWFALAAKQGDADAASKRDQIGTKLSADKLSAIKVAADVWQPKPAAAEANEVAAPADGWDDAVSGRASTN